VQSARVEASGPSIAALQDEIDVLRRSLIGAEEGRARADDEWQTRTQRLRIELEGERTRRDTEVSRQLGAAEREWRERLAREVAYARVTAAEAAREAAEAAARAQLESASHEWREHLARAVLLTRQEVDSQAATASPSRGRSPTARGGRLPGSQERLELLAEFGSAARLGIRRHAQPPAPHEPARAISRPMHPPGAEGKYGKYRP